MPWNVLMILHAVLNVSVVDFLTRDSTLTGQDINGENK